MSTDELDVIREALESIEGDSYMPPPPGLVAKIDAALVRLDALAVRLRETEQERDIARDYVSSLHGAKSYQQLSEVTDALAAERAVARKLREALEEGKRELWVHDPPLSLPIEQTFGWNNALVAYKRFVLAAALRSGQAAKPPEEEGC